LLNLKGEIRLQRATQHRELRVGVQSCGYLDFYITAHRGKLHRLVAFEAGYLDLDVATRRLRANRYHYLLNADPTADGLRVHGPCYVPDDHVSTYRFCAQLTLNTRHLNVPTDRRDALESIG